MRIQVLGPVRAWRNGTPIDVGPPGRRAVLGLLALAGGKPLTRAELIDALWASQPPSTAVNILQTQVKHLRQLLEPDRPKYTASGFLPKIGDGYALRVPPQHIDIFRFRGLVDSAAAHERDGAMAEAMKTLAEAIALWQGPPLVDVPQLATHPKVVALKAERRAALARHGAVLLAAGTAADALPMLEEVAAEQPLDEAAQARLIRAYQLAGRRAQAFATYHAVRRRLAEELGVDPGPELSDVHTALIEQDGPPGPRAAPERTAKTDHAKTDHAKTDHAAAGRSRPRPSATPAVPAQLPPDLPGFAGRTALLRQLDLLLPTRQHGAGSTPNPQGLGGGEPRESSRTGGGPATVVISAVHGAAGVGKTALAIHWAHRVADRFPDGQLYVNLRGFDPSGPPMHPTEAIRVFLDALGVATQRVPVSLPAQIGLYRTLLARRRMLVLLDNAYDAEQVRPLLPGASGSLALVTSRNELSGLIASAGAVPLHVDLPSTGEARLMLANRLGPDRVASEPDATEEIIARCARLPLALAVVAARAASRPAYRLATLADELRRARADESQDDLEPFAGDDPATDVRAVFSWSYRALHGPAARLFRLLSQHPGGELGQPAAASLAGVPADRAGRLLDELLRAHLVAERAPGRYTVHDLLRSYAAELAGAIDTAVDRTAARHRALDHYLHTGFTAAALLYPDKDLAPPTEPMAGVTPEPLAGPTPALAWFAAEHSVLLAAVDAGSDIHACQLARLLTEPLDRQAHWHALAQVQRTSLAAAQRLGDRGARAHAHRDLALAHARLDHEEASRLHLRLALDLYSEVGDRAGQARAHLGLAWMLGVKRQPEDALRHAEQALALFTDAGNPRGQANAMNTVGWFHAQAGNYQQSLRCCRLALAMHGKLGDRAGQADTWDSLGLAHHRLDQHREAVGCYRQALRLYRELAARYNEADTLGRLGDAQLAGGQLNATRQSWLQALAILDELGHPAADETRRRLAGLDAQDGAPDGDGPTPTALAASDR